MNCSKQARSRVNMYFTAHETARSDGLRISYNITNSNTCFLRKAQLVRCLSTDWTTGVRSPAGAKNFSSILCVREAHTAFFPIYTGGPFPGINSGRGVKLTTRHHI
jgi:hypothetical protein